MVTGSRDVEVNGDRPKSRRGDVISFIPFNPPVDIGEEVFKDVRLKDLGDEIVDSVARNFACRISDEQRIFGFQTWLPSMSYRLFGKGDLV